MLKKDPVPACRRDGIPARRRENMKSGSHFHFKKFSVAHGKSTHKVGTDGVLLGAWVNVENTRHILDVGTGSGVIALMLAQRTSPEVSIDAVEIEKEDALQAAENFKVSPWPEKIRLYQTALQAFSPKGKYELIVSNPPFFINSWPPAEMKRRQARHTHQLSFTELLQFSATHLAPHGRLAVILPQQEGLHFAAQSAEKRFYCIRQCAFRSRLHKPIERYLLEFCLTESTKEAGELLLYDKNNDWSEGYVKLTRDFYLKI